jgi:ribosomal silencing factor RsfS
MTELIISLENLININNKIKELQQVDELWATMLKDLANKLLIVVDVNEKIQIDKHMTIIRGNATETVAEIRGFDQLRKEDIKKITEQYHEKFELISSETWKLISMMNIDLGYTRGGD